MGRDFAAERAHQRSEIIRKGLGILTPEEKAEVERRAEEARRRSAAEQGKGRPLPGIEGM